MLGAMPNICRICHSQSEHAVFHAREMMFGSKEPFAYFECHNCGCVQIVDIPTDLGRHYPANYYSFDQTSAPIAPTPERIATMQAFLETGKGDREFRKWQWLPKLGITLDSNILDAGCGSGALLLALHSYGFRNVHGVDPYIEKTLTHANGVNVEKAELASLSGPYDVIMLHHAFEHLPDQHALLAELKRLLAPKGTLLLRIPIASSYAWETFCTDWVQLDPPRHLYLHTVKSLTALAQQHEMKVEEIMYDSTAFQFTGSHLYQRGIALVDEKKHRPPLYRLRRLYYSLLARRLNKQGRGDQACFLLKYSNSTG